MEKAGEERDVRKGGRRQEKGSKVWRKGKKGRRAVKLRRKGKEGKWEGKKG